MREIKFRVWDTNFGRMKTSGMGVNGGVLSANDGDIIMQYTGLKDRNDVEIYEGDIVIVIVLCYDGCYLKYIIEHDHGVYILKRDGTFLDLISDYNTSNELEVIGNIYENPELLKENSDE